MKSHPSLRSTFVLLSMALLLAGLARADFNPIALNPASYNHDVVVEKTAPPPLSSAVNATMDAGTNNSGNTWFEVGYYPGRTNGLPAQNSLLSNATGEHTWRMPPDYHTNNVILVGHAGGAATPVVASGTVTLTTPAAFSALSFLATSGNGPVTVGYTIHYADSTTEAGINFIATDWFNAATAGLVRNCAGRLSVSGGGLQNIDATPAAKLYQSDVPLSTPTINVTSVDFYYAASGANNLIHNNGRTAIFAISGSTDNVNFNPIAVSGYTYDIVVEADGPQTQGTGLASSGAPTNNITATMDGGLAKTGNVWYEQGYYAGIPSSGLPQAGAAVNSATLPAHYTMPASYSGNCAVVLAGNVSNANISVSSPAPYRALSLLAACANGDTIVPCVLQFQDGTTETNAIVINDWFDRDRPQAYSVFGRMVALNRSLNSTADQRVNPFVGIAPAPFALDFRGLGLPVPRLFDSVIYVTNSASAITNIALNFTNGAASTRFVSIFAVSGSAGDTLPPIFGVAGSAALGQPGGAVLNNAVFTKRWEGTNNILLSTSLRAGTPPVSYQWKRALRGGGLRDLDYTFDYSTFVNVTDGGRISGSTSNNLVISNALSADNYDYLVVASNAYGTATSYVATVMVLTTNFSILLGAPAGDTIAGYTGEGTPAAESIDHAIDRVAQKWLSFGQNNQVLPFTGPIGFTVTPAQGASVVTSMRFYTANDTQGRDPMDYFLEGSNDGATWAPITGGFLKGTLILPTGRNGTGSTAVDPLNQNVQEVDFFNNAGYKSYRFSITNTIDRYRQSLMQIAEIELLGSFLPAPPVWVRQPEPAVTVYVGSSPTFVVAASGVGALAPKYQWFRNVTTPITGATNRTYTFPNAQLVDSGTTFTCVATNSFGQITSSGATLTVIAAPTQSYPATVLADNALGYWRLNEGPDNGSGNNGVVAHDYRSGRNGYYSNVVLQVDGYNPASDPDKAGDFGSVVPANSFVAEVKDVDFARAANTAGAVFSVEAWTYAGSQTAGAAIVAKGYNGILAAGTGTGTEQFVLDVLGNPSAFRFLVRDAAGNGVVAQSAVVPYDPIALVPTLRHLVGVCDQPNGRIYLYVDGVLAATGNLGTTVGILAQPLAMTIGARKSGGTAEYNNQWLGRIDDVAVYNAALSPSQVLSHFYAAQRPPIITLQPTNQTTPDNVSVTFSSSAYGPQPLAYQWYLSNGTEPISRLAGQTSSNLTFTTTAAQNGSFYQLVVTNSYGATTGSVAQLTVVSGPPSFLVDMPSSSTFLIGHVVQLRVVAGGTAPFTYQWQKNGANIANNYRTIGAQTDVLTLAYANFSDSGNYQVLVNGVGSTPSTLNAVVVTNATQAAPFTASATGWTLNGTPTAAVMGNNTLQLTAGLGNTARSAFLNAQQIIGAFTASFIYQVTGGAGGADGVTFCIQNDARGATAPQGAGGGGGLGYTGTTPSVALALNIYDPNTRGILLLQNGAVTPPFRPIAPVLVGGNANPIQVSVNYASGVLTATFRDTVTAATYTTNITVDIPVIVGSGSAYVGFTGADGGVVSTQVISSFAMPALLPVSLTAQRVGDSLVFSWPASAGAVLRSSPTLNPAVWSDVTAPWQMIGNQAVVTVSPLLGNQFYRLDVYP